jgi:diguanylate cyclase (GGDEF)-like protein
MDKLDDVVRGMDAGADDYLTKPFAPQELEVRLRAGQRILDLQNELLAAQQALEMQATRDALTGLWNRRAILQKLPVELSRAQRESIPLGVILTDIDHFKRVNDSYGHAQGDYVLQEVAKRMTESVRAYDYVARYGGEEFLITVVDADHQQTFHLAERIRQSIIGAPMMLRDGPVQISSSFGLTVMPPGAKGRLEDLIEAADRALYRAKKNGRNRVESLAWDEVDQTGPRPGKLPDADRKSTQENP